MQKLDLTLFFRRVGFLSFLFFRILYFKQNYCQVVLMCLKYVSDHPWLFAVLAANRTFQPRAIFEYSLLIRSTQILMTVEIKELVNWKKPFEGTSQLLRSSDGFPHLPLCKIRLRWSAKEIEAVRRGILVFIFIYSSHLQICYMDSFHFLLFVHAKIWSIDCAYRRLHMTSVRTEILKSGKWQLLLWIVGGHEYNLLNFDCSGYAISSFDEVKFSSSFCYSFLAKYWQICYLWNL